MVFVVLVNLDRVPSHDLGRTNPTITNLILFNYFVTCISYLSLISIYFTIICYYNYNFLLGCL